MKNLMLLAGCLCIGIQSHVQADPAYPMDYGFRGEYKVYSKRTYQEWADYNEGNTAIIRKYYKYDELDKVDFSNNRLWAETYKQANPDMLMTLHWNARELRNDQSGFSDQFFPGHWLSYVGTDTNDDIDKTKTSFKVLDSSVFKLKNNGEFRYPVLLLVEKLADGSLDWSKYEYVRLVSKNDDVNTIDVERGHAFSKAQWFPAGVVVRSMSTRLSNAGLFDINWSVNAPKDSQGRSAADIIVAELTNIIAAGGEMDFLDGISFDVLQRYPRSADADVDFDGIPDNGVINGVNTWEQGIIDFVAALRLNIGMNKVLTADGYVPINQRLYG